MDIDRAEELRLLENTFDRLWPICRSITGNGLRQSLDILSTLIPLTQYEVASGTQVFDWKVPLEWNIQAAYLITPSGDKIADFHENNLHIVSYSVPVNEYMGYEALALHLHYSDELPDAIPYRTSYYAESWGFCITKNQFLRLPEKGRYKVHIDSSLSHGALTYGDLVIPGETEKEILFTTYLCHPSLANNELSGPLVLAGLYRRLIARGKRHYTYRFVVAPETIGSIVYLSKHAEHLKKSLKAGYVVTCAGGPSGLTYKRSRRKNAYPDRVAEHVLNRQGEEYQILDFSPIGSDERQYCSPGINLPVGSLMKTKYGEYPEYHTSFDNKAFMRFDELQKSIDAYAEIIEIMENDIAYRSTQPNCEPQLGRRGLYRSLGDGRIENELQGILWVLNYSDGEHSLLDIAELSQLPFSVLRTAARLLRKSGLLKLEYHESTK